LRGRLYAAVRANEQKIHAEFAALLAEMALSTLASVAVIR